MQEFKLHDLGEGMKEAEVRRWLVKPGDMVKLDQVVAEVETDKAVVELPSPFAGRVADIRAPEGTVVPVGGVLVVFDTDTAGGASTAPAPSAKGPVNATTQAAVSTPAPSSRARILAAPAVRKRAFELGVDLEQVTSSQPNGRITMDDVLAYVARAKESAPPASPSPLHETSRANGATRAVDTRPRQPERVLTESTAVEERQPLVGLRKRIAERMELSWRTVPHATAFDELDGTELVALRQSLKSVAEQRGVRLTYMPLLVKLLLPVLKEFPIFNASLDEERREIIYKHVYHIGIAADSPEGLLVPVLRDADKLTMMQIAQQLEHLIEGAQKRTLTLPEAAGSTFTLNNVGSFGGGSGTPIINYPEVAILAVGRLQEKAIVRDGSVIVRTMMPLALSFDHRLIDGAQAGRFLGRFKELVEHPQQLLLDML